MKETKHFTQLLNQLNELVSHPERLENQETSQAPKSRKTSFRPNKSMVKLKSARPMRTTSYKRISSN